MKYFSVFLNGLLILIASYQFSDAQTLELTIANAHVAGSSFVFDVYLRATTGTVYLAGADFVLTFNAGNFTNPVVTKGANATFMLNNTNGDNTTQAGGAVGAQYRTNLSPAAITTNEIILNFNAFAVPDQETFDSDVAKIDNTLYKFGTYTVTGVSNPAGTMGLAWKTGGGGVTTKVYTFATTTPWNQTLVTLSTPGISNSPLPVELASFTASANGRRIELAWSTATEVKNSGFDVERRMVDGKAKTWQAVAFVKGHGTTNAPQSYSLRDAVNIPAKYAYRLKQIDADGKFLYTKEVEAVVALQPEDYALGANYPNPFNPTTSFRFAVRKAGHVAVKVFNMIGQEVATLFNETAVPDIVYDVTFDASGLASGTYFYALKTQDRFEVKKMLLLR
jgi:hypothetical protein